MPVASPPTLDATLAPSPVSPAPAPVPALEVNCSQFPGTVACGDFCVDVLASAAHCGSCNNACPSGATCTDGACQFCAAGTTECVAGTCHDLNTDPSNCGSCGHSCQGAQCLGGVCQCPGGGIACGGTCVPRDDTLNCGSCGNVCPQFTDCVGGNCMCIAGLAVCGPECVDLSTDGSNCGTCGNDCVAQGRFCSEASCVDECPEDATTCGGSCVHLDRTLTHCGACGVTCASGSQCIDARCVASIDVDAGVP